MVEVHVDREVYRDLDESLLLEMTKLFMSRSMGNDVDISIFYERMGLIREIVTKVLSRGVFSDAEKERYVEALSLDYDRARKVHDRGSGSYIDERASARGRELHSKSNPDPK